MPQGSGSPWKFQLRSRRSTHSGDARAAMAFAYWGQSAIQMLMTQVEIEVEGVVVFCGDCMGAIDFLDR